MPRILCEHESQVAACKSFTVVFIAFTVVVTSDSTISTLPDSHRAILFGAILFFGLEEEEEEAAAASAASAAFFALAVVVIVIVMRMESELKKDLDFRKKEFCGTNSC